MTGSNPVENRGRTRDALAKDPLLEFDALGSTPTGVLKTHWTLREHATQTGGFN